MGKLLVIFLLLILSLHSVSQFNDSIHYYFRFASSGIINKTGTNNLYIANNALTFKTQKKNITFNTLTTWIYGEQQHSLINNDFAAHSDIGLFKGIRKLYYWGLINYDKSYSLKIDYRLQAGAGFAYSFIDSPYLWINISEGILYERGDITDPIIGQDRYQIPRNSLRFLYHWSLKERFIIDGTHFYQPSFKSTNDYIIQSSNNVSIKLKKWLSLTGAFVYNKVSRTKRENFQVSYGLSAETYF
jgi:hypothetical protein